ncbi:UNVERIFIED_CONTAM: hypothetical protein FKN15_067175 [Acipenser sinensis]
MFPIHDSKTPKIVRILTQEIFTSWGTPRFLVSDRGPQFTSQLIIEVCKSWGVVRKLTTSYHPQSNLTERVNRTVNINTGTSGYQRFASPSTALVRRLLDSLQLSWLLVAHLKVPSTN